MKKMAMPLYDANLCTNCDTVFSYTTYSGSCPACLSTHNISLVAVLNPPEKETPHEKTDRLRLIANG